MLSSRSKEFDASLMRVVVRSVHEDLVERLKEGLYHHERDVCIGLVSYHLSI